MTTNIHEGQTSTALADLKVGQTFVLYGGSGYKMTVLKPARINAKGRMTIRIQYSFKAQPETLSFPFIRGFGYDEVMVLPD